MGRGSRSRGAIADTSSQVPVAFAIGSLRTARIFAAALSTIPDGISAAARPVDRSGHRLAASRLSLGFGGRVARPLAVLRHRGPEEYGGGISRESEGGGMNLKRLIGLDNLASDYAYGRDAETGYTS